MGAARVVEGGDVQRAKSLRLGDSRRETVAKLGLESVPDLGAFVLDHKIDDLVAMAEGKSLLNPKIEREGIVLRPETPMKDDRGNRVSFKAINPRFLLKYEA